MSAYPNTLAILIGDPWGYLLADTTGLRVMRPTAFVRHIGGMKRHHEMKARNEIVSIHHLRYDRDRARRDVDAIGRSELWIDFEALFMLAASDGGVSNGEIERLFAYRDDADAAIADLNHFGRFVTAARRSIGLAA